MKITIVEHSYPNPDCKYGEFSINGIYIGNAEKNPSGWNLLWGRKILTEKEAAVAILRRTIRESKKAKIEASAKLVGAMMMLKAMNRM